MPVGQRRHESTKRTSPRQQSLSGKLGGKKYKTRHNLQKDLNKESARFNALPSGRFVNIFMPHVSLLKSQKNKRLATIKEEQSQRIHKVGKNPKKYNTIDFSMWRSPQHIPMWPPHNTPLGRKTVTRDGRRGNPIRRPTTVAGNYLSVGFGNEERRVMNEYGFKRAMKRHEKDKQSRISRSQRIYLTKLKKDNPKEYSGLLKGNPLFREWNKRPKNANYNINNWAM